MPDFDFFSSPDTAINPPSGQSLTNPQPQLPPSNLPYTDPSQSLLQQWWAGVLQRGSDLGDLQQRDALWRAQNPNSFRNSPEREAHDRDLLQGFLLPGSAAAGAVDALRGVSQGTQGIVNRLMSRGSVYSPEVGQTVNLDRTVEALNQGSGHGVGFSPASHYENTNPVATYDMLQKSGLDPSSYMPVGDDIYHPNHPVIPRGYEVYTAPTGKLDVRNLNPSMPQFVADAIDTLKAVLRDDRGGSGGKAPEGWQYFKNETGSYVDPTTQKTIPTPPLAGERASTATPMDDGLTTMGAPLTSKLRPYVDDLVSHLSDHYAHFPDPKGSVKSSIARAGELARNGDAAGLRAYLLSVGRPDIDNAMSKLP